MNYTNQMVSVPSELLEQALDAAAAVGMQDVADELDRILTPKAEQDQVKPVAWVIFDNGFIDDHTTDKDLAAGWHEQGFAVSALYDHADSGEVERLRDANLHHRNLQVEADDLIESLRKQLSEIQQAAGAVLAARDSDDYPHGHPGHCHEVPGQWDSTGAPCQECAAYDRLEALSGSPEPGVKP